MSPSGDEGCTQASHLRADRNSQDHEVVSRPMSTLRHRWPILALAAVVALVSGACGSAAPSAPPGTGLAITAAAGPTCPVERIPPDPACAPRPVAGATILVVDGRGNTVATVLTDAEGTAVASVPAGDYVVRPQPVVGLMGTAQAQDVTILDGSLTPVTLAYDTGIR